MSEFNIEVQGGSSVRLPTAGKYCPKDIIVTASGGGGTEEIETLIDESGVLDSTEGEVTEKVEQLIEKAQWEYAVIYKFYADSSSPNNAFNGTGATKIPQLDFSKKTNCLNLCRDMKFLKRVDYYIDAPLCTSYNNAFQGTTNLKYMKGVNTVSALSVGGMYNSSGIEEIEEPFDFSSISSANNTTAFVGATELKEVRFVSECIYWSIRFGSSYLSDESIQSIIDGLATVETAQTLTLHADVKAKLTDDQKKTISDKNWNLA